MELGVGGEGKAVVGLRLPGTITPGEDDGPRGDAGVEGQREGAGLGLDAQER